MKTAARNVAVLRATAGRDKVAVMVCVREGVA
jgi:hypothetical protein